jgi:hypothetical protein
MCKGIARSPPDKAPARKNPSTSLRERHAHAANPEHLSTPRGTHRAGSRLTEADWPVDESRSAICVFRGRHAHGHRELLD